MCQRKPAPPVVSAWNWSQKIRGPSRPVIIGARNAEQHCALRGKAYDPAVASFEVLLGFDMETDMGSWTPFYEGLIEATPAILRVFRDQNAKGTFYFVGEAARDHPGIVEQVCSAGHEAGAHSLFHETVGDPIFEIPRMPPLLPHEVEPRLRLNTEWIEEICGVRPRSFRCPRLFGSTAVCRALESLGYLSDATYPLYHFRERLEPYHPSADQWLEPGDLKLVEIPNFADLQAPSSDAFGHDINQWPVFRSESAEALLARVDRFLDFLAERNCQRKVVSFYFHPWEFHPMPKARNALAQGRVHANPLVTVNCGDFALEQFDLLIAGLRKRGAAFKTAAEIAAATP